MCYPGYMKRILIIQNRISPEAIATEQEAYRIACGETVELTFLSSLDESLSWTSPEEALEGYDGVILGGSRELDFDGGRENGDPFKILAFLISSRAKNLAGYALVHKVPLLGICFGHQIIGKIRGGAVLKDDTQSKRGTFAITRTPEGAQDALFKHLPETFDVQYGHNDSVTELPEGATLLASGKNCHFSALRYGKNNYTFQFHPELTGEMLLTSIKNNTDLLPRGTKNAEDIVRSSPDASRIIPLWVKHIVHASQPQ